jgi:hypothetical protein
VIEPHDQISNHAPGPFRSQKENDDFWIKAFIEGGANRKTGHGSPAVKLMNWRTGPATLRKFVNRLMCGALRVQPGAKNMNSAA